MNINIDRFMVIGNSIVERMTGEVLYDSVASNLEIQRHCDILNGRFYPEWINEEHLMWAPVQKKRFVID
jgi:hypothetical protein